MCHFSHFFLKFKLKEEDATKKDYREVVLNHFWVADLFENLSSGGLRKIERVQILCQQFQEGP